MTSRVQKGGQVFKPNVNPRGSRLIIATPRPAPTAENRNQELSPGGASIGAFSLNTSTEHLDATQPGYLPNASRPLNRDTSFVDPPPVSRQPRAPVSNATPIQISVPSTREERFIPPPNVASQVDLASSSQSLFFPSYSLAIQTSATSPVPLVTEIHQPSDFVEPRLSAEGSQKPKPRSSKKRGAHAGDSGQTPEPRKKSQRKSSSSPSPKKKSESVKSRKSRPPSLPPFDPDVDPGEEIDPTVVTMAEICTDRGQGRVSSKAALIETNHAAWKESGRGKRVEMKSTMEAKKYGREESEQAANKGKETPSRAASTSATQNSEPGSSAAGGGGNASNGFDYSEDFETSRFNVQVRIGPNGETVIDEESLFVDRNEVNENFDNYTHVEESDQTKFTNSGTYGKKYRGSRWSSVETELFYDALSQFGENYELISYVLPGRDRKACKAKFKAEDKKDPQRIDYCLKNRRPYDLKTLERMTGKDFSGPTPQIRAPTPLTLAQPEDPTANETAPPTPKKRPPRQQSQVNMEEEIIGVVDDE